MNRFVDAVIPLIGALAVAWVVVGSAIVLVRGGC